MTDRKKLAGWVMLGILAGGNVWTTDVGTVAAAERTAQESIRLSDSYVRPDYVEVEKLRDTKQIIVITKKDMEEKGYKSISDVLKDQPSINVGATGWGQVDIRGQGSEQATRNIQVLVDGAPITTMVNHPLPNNYDYVPMEQIEKIEIIPGGGSVIYGSGAAGGIINITTNLRSLQKPRSSVNTEWNSDGYRASVNYGTKVGDKAAVQAGFARLDRDLFFVNTYRKSNYAYGGFRYDADLDHSLTFRYSHLEEDSKFLQNVSRWKIDAYGHSYRPDKDSDYLNGDRELDTYNLSYNQNFGAKLKYSGDFFYTDGYYTNTKFFDGKMKTKSYGSRMRLDWSYGSSDSLLMGVDIFEQESHLKYKTSVRGKLMDFNYDKTTEALYLLNKMKRGRLTYTQGLRREKLIWKFDKDGGTAARPIGGVDSSNRWNTAGELSVGYQYSDLGKVFLRYERGYTSPDGLQICDEVYSDRSRKVYAATDAQEERYNLWEMGLRDKWGASTVSLTLFASETNNELERPYFRGAYGWEYRTYNMYNTKRRGVETSFSQRLGKLRLQEGYTYLHGRRDYTAQGRALMAAHGEDEIDFTNSGLKAVPQHKVLLTADYKFDKQWSVNAKYTFFGKYNNFIKESDRHEDGNIVHSYGLLDLGFKFQQNKDLTWYGGVTNVLGKDYYEYDSAGGATATLVPGAERTYFVGMNYKF
ncbi:iron complex outermembrane recepter protein [Selenomonas ruminantium]|uniref:Iron complex outermembrane recepter protein n=1 Tax=Selenomonas ruminantium TaxID=971 RepID=A0A1M6USA3_SELRU|nr:TonB-dependent receptor [Selenomonas ruminantium]SHK72080.1 iron complex outermembrane recepter protein [Selenomonas ruminantium]